MAAKPVQISLDEDLLHRIDEDVEVKDKGRSAFIRSAVEYYFLAKKRQQLDRQIREAYEGEADDMRDEIRDILGAQAWPAP